jgi:hypothetical protein
MVKRFIEVDESGCGERNDQREEISGGGNFYH